MAVINDYVNAKLAKAVGKPAGGLSMIAGNLFIGMECFEVAAADDNDSIYRVFKNVDSNLIPVSLRVACDATAGITDTDFGFYDSLEDGGAEVDKDILADGIDLSAGYSRILALDALVTVNIVNAMKPIWELLGKTLNTKKGAYDLCMTSVAAASAPGTILVTGLFAQG